MADVVVGGLMMLIGVLGLAITLVLSRHMTMTLRDTGLWMLSALTILTGIVLLIVGYDVVAYNLMESR